MSTNGINTAEEAGMAECDGEKVVTMMDVLQEQEEFEEDANAVLGASDDKNCTYSKGYIKRQAVYACLTCCSEAKDDPSKRAGVCLACSLTCHENHDLIELYTKRNFRCDCGNPKFNSHPCQFTPDKTELNEDNKYDQNFSGLYCICQRPYPDPESTFEDEMIQCIICEDWLHSSHLDATVPTNEQYAEMICKGCMEKNEFIHDYSDFAVNNESNNVDIMAVDGAEAISANTTSETNGTLEKTLVNGDIKSSETNIESETKEEMDVDTPAKESESKDKESDSGKMLESTVNENAMDTDKTEEIVTANIKESENSEDTNQTEATKESNEILDNKSENNTSNDTVAETNETENADQPENNSSVKQCDGDKEPTNETPQMEVTEGEPGKEEISSNIPNDDISKDSKESKSEESLEKANSDPVEELVAENKEDADDSQENKEKDGDESQENKEKDADDSQENKEKVVDDSQDNKEEKTDGSQAAIANDENNDGSNQNESGDIVKSPTEGVVASAQNENEVEPAQKETGEESGPVESEIKSTDSAIESEPTKPGEDLPSESEAKSVPNETEAKSLSVEDEVAQTNNDHPSKENNEESENIELASNVQENKRKLSTEQADIDQTITKKAKLDASIQCARPKGVKKRFKGATFWPSNFRQKLCTCNECISMYKDLSVLFLIDPEDTVTAYETLGKEKINGAPASQYEKGLLALSSLDRVHQINALTEYNKMRDKLLDFLKSFKDRKEVVKEEDIKAFFAEMKPKREPDGVYFCR